MSDATICENCGTVLRRKAGADTWLRLLEPDPEAVPTVFSLGLARLDLCSWKCVAEFSSLRLLDPSPRPSA